MAKSEAKNEAKNDKKGGSRVLTGFLAFFLGFLFAIIVELSSIAGVVWFVMNRDLDTVLSTVGLKNRDENGNNIYINTDRENGGVTSIKELIASIGDLVYKDGEIVAIGKSFNDFSNLIPATDIVLGYVYNVLDEYIEIDHDEFESRPVSDLPQLLSDSIMNIKTAALLEKLGVTSVAGDSAETLVKSLVTGAETEYATVNTGIAAANEGDAEGQLKFPVLYDYYTYEDILKRYYRLDGQVGGTDVLPDNLTARAENPEELFTKFVVNGETRYALYYVPCRVTENGIEEAAYSYQQIEKTYGTGENAKINKLDVLTYGGDTDFIVVTPDADGKFQIDYNAVYGAFDEEAADDYSYRFTGYSYAANVASEYYYIVDDKDNERYELKTRSGKNYFRDNSGKLRQLDPLTLLDIVNDPYAPLDSVAVTEVLGKNSGDIAYKVFRMTSLGDLLRGDVKFDELVEDVDLSAIVTNVAPDNDIMAYLVYKIYDLTPAGAGEGYTATYDDGNGGKAVRVTVENNSIKGVYASDGTPMDGVKVKDVAALAKNMPISTVMDIKADDAISSYIGYGLYSVKKAEDGSVDALGNAYGYTGKVKLGDEEKECYISCVTSSEGDPVINSVWYTEEDERVTVKGTKVGGVSARVDGFTADLTVGEILGLNSSDNALMQAIKDTKINGLEDKVKELTVDEVVSGQDMQRSSLLKQLSGVKLSDLGSEIDNIMVQRIYADNVYEGVEKDADPVLWETYDPEILYYVKEVGGDGKTVTFKLFEENALARDPLKGSTYDEELGHVTREQFEAEGAEFYSYGRAKGMWRLILNVRNTNEAVTDENGNKLVRREKAYTLNNFNNMVSESAVNINEATLEELREAGIISATDADLAKTLPVDGDNKALGKMTLKELINVAISLAQEPQQAA